MKTFFKFLALVVVVAFFQSCTDNTETLVENNNYGNETYSINKEDSTTSISTGGTNHDDDED